MFLKCFYWSIKTCFYVFYSKIYVFTITFSRCNRWTQWRMAKSFADFCLWLSTGDEAIHIAVALRLWLDLCVPDVCRYGLPADASDLHACVCKQVPGRLKSQGHCLPSFSSAGIYPQWKYHPVSLVLASSVLMAFLLVHGEMRNGDVGSRSVH